MDKSEFEGVHCPHPELCVLSGNTCIVAKLIESRVKLGQKVQDLVTSTCQHSEKLREIERLNGVN